MDMETYLSRRTGRAADGQQRVVARKPDRYKAGEAGLPRASAAGVFRLAVPDHYQACPRLCGETFRYSPGAASHVARHLAPLSGHTADFSRVAARIAEDRRP